MKGELVPMKPHEADLLFERVASHYAELLDRKNGTPVKIEEALDSVIVAHPHEYPREDWHGYLERLRTKEFNEYLQARRAEYIVNTIAPRLVAAEMGSVLSKLALQELVGRLTLDPSAMSDKSLLAVAKLGQDMASKIDIGDVHQKNERNDSAFNQLIVMLPEDMRQGAVADLVRRALVKGLPSG